MHYGSVINNIRFTKYLQKYFDFRSGSLSRQSTIESDTETTTATAQSSSGTANQPIKKSPREFIIPIAVEGGGFITPRAGSLEPTELNQSTTPFGRLGRHMRMG